MTTKPFPAAVLSSVIASDVLPNGAMAQTEPAQGSITATDGAVATPVAAQDMATPAPEMQSVLDKLAELGAQPLHTLTSLRTLSLYRCAAVIELQPLHKLVSLLELVLLTARA